MSLNTDAQKLRDRFLQALIDAARPLQDGPDPEIMLEALIDAAGQLRDRLRAELVELRLEQAD